jgi:drug/metabolite transporter (DMT)-like permease
LKIRGILYSIISAFIFGFTPALANITYSLGNNSLSMTFYRNLFVIPVLLVIIKYKKIDLKVNSKELKNIFLLSIFGVAATTILLYSSYTYIGIGSATTLHFMYPMFVALACRFVFKEELGKRKVLALALAFIGVLFFFDTKEGGSILGAAMALVSGVTYSFYMVWLEKKELVNINPFKLSLYIGIFTSAALFIGSIFGRYIRFSLPLNAYLLMVVVSLLTSIIATVLFQLGVSKIGSISASMFSLFEPITSVLAGVLLFNEAITVNKIIGCIIILISLAYLSIMNKENSDLIDKSSEEIKKEIGAINN